MDAWRILTGQDREGTIHALDSRVPDDSNRLKERICQLFYYESLGFEHQVARQV